MRVHVSVRIDTDPASPQEGYGNLQFNEDAEFKGAGFETISRIFTRCHELLEAMKREHAISSPGARK